MVPGVAESPGGAAAFKSQHPASAPSPLLRYLRAMAEPAATDFAALLQQVSDEAVSVGEFSALLQQKVAQEEACALARQARALIEQLCGLLQLAPSQHATLGASLAADGAAVAARLTALLAEAAVGRAYAASLAARSVPFVGPAERVEAGVLALVTLGRRSAGLDLVRFALDKDQASAWCDASEPMLAQAAQCYREAVAGERGLVKQAALAAYDAAQPAAEGGGKEEEGEEEGEGGGGGGGGGGKAAGGGAPAKALAPLSSATLVNDTSQLALLLELNNAFPALLAAGDFPVVLYPAP